MTVTDAAARARLALVVVLAGVLAGVASLVAVASVAPTMSAQSLVALAALTAAIAGVARCPVVVAYAAARTLQPRSRAADVPLVLAGRCTDAVHHPVRPRAPGRA